MSQADAMTRAQRGTAADQARADPRARWMIHAAAGAIACAALVPSAMPAHAQAQGQAASSAVAVPIDIASQPLAEALMQLARQTNVDISAPSRVTRGRTAPAVSGTLTVPQALARLLAGTPLSARALRANAYVVEAPGESLAAGGGRNRGSSYGDDLRPEGQEGIAEILVVGSRSQNVDIRRTESDVQPYVVFNAEEIERSGVQNLEQFFVSRLTQNAQQPSLSPAKGVGAATGSVDLRGLGTDQTLILVDGRRLPSVAVTGTLSQPVLRGIPLSSIERIEVLPTTASGIYGGGATGGVINIILKRDYEGADLEAEYGNSFKGDVSHLRLAFSAGFSLNEGRTRAAIRASHSTSGVLRNSERPFSDRAARLLMETSPSSFFFDAGGSVCATTFAFVSSQGCNGGTLILDNGTTLNSNRTSVPAGYAGPQSLIRN